MNNCIKKEVAIYEFFYKFIKVYSVFYISELLFIGIEFNKALIIAIISYSGPKLIDYIYFKIKNIIANS